jgi:flavin reductase (DIM6/NTAB) family NADH-FMN oxidoreductase RutF
MCYLKREDEVKVYIVQTWDSYESKEILGVFDNKDTAVAELDNHILFYGEVIRVEMGMIDPDKKLVYAKLPGNYILDEE